MNILWVRAIGFAAAFVMLSTGCDHRTASQGASSEAQPATAAGGNAPAAVRGSDGTLALAYPNGAPVEGFKLSQYDWAVISPCIAVGSDGVIHVAFVEQIHTAPWTFFVFHRQSTDGGKTWTDPKNLSEDMPNVGVGTCKMIIDGQNRVYVIWRTAIGPYGNGDQTEAGSSVNNLVYRCLENGKWSKYLQVHKPTSKSQDDGSKPTRVGSAPAMERNGLSRSV